ncbi:MAG: cytochrome-c peroxidase, partial [Panacagrimonas sp.]
AAPDATLGLPSQRSTSPSEAERALGQALFFDRRLSFNGTMSCSMCHVPEQGFTSTESRTAVGMEGKSLPRNAPTLLNVGWLSRLFHDGRENSLATQAWSPLLNPMEMGNPSTGYVLEKIAALPEYRPLFVAAYGTPTPNMSQVGEALQAFERSLVAAGSRFDQWFYAKRADAMGEQEQAGFRLFTGKAGCSACHQIGATDSLFTDERYHATGVSMRSPASTAAPIRLAEGVFTHIDNVELSAFANDATPDLGRFEITLDPADRYTFRTPSLRNVDRTAPYMHDGSLPTLEAVVAFYDSGGGGVPNKSPLIRPLGLTSDEQAALVHFLKALTSPAAESLPRQLRASDRRYSGSSTHE